jgi:hypothetical protein
MKEPEAAGKKGFARLNEPSGLIGVQSSEILPEFLILPPARLKTLQQSVLHALGEVSSAVSP